MQDVAHRELVVTDVLLQPIRPVFKDGPLTFVSIGFPEPSVTNYQSTQCNILEELRFHLHHSVSMKSHVFSFVHPLDAIIKICFSVL